MEARDLSFSNDLKVWPNSSVGRALDIAEGCGFKSSLVSYFLAL